MRKQIEWIMAAGLVVATAGGAQATELLTATSMAFPYRSVAETEDVYALRYNPAGMAYDIPVEMAWLHSFARQGTAGDNALMLRAKALAVSVSWIKDRGAGKRREYMIGAGRSISPEVSIGTSLGYIKADAPELNSKTVLTHSLMYKYSPMLTAGLRWENPWHMKVAGQSTSGLIVGGLAAKPLGKKLSVHADWFYPDKGGINKSWVRGSALVHLNGDLDLSGFADTEGHFGVELRLLRDRSAAGVELRGTDHTRYTDGTFYISVLNRAYHQSAEPPAPPPIN